MIEARATAESRIGKRGPSTTWIVSTIVGLTVAVTVSVLYWFDPNRYSFYPTCLFHRVTGLLCPGCGALRAMHQLLHGHVLAAFQYNPVLVTGLPLLAIFAGSTLIATLRDKRVTLRVSRKWLLLIVAVGMAISIWRNIPGSPFFIPSTGGPPGHW